MHPDAFAPRPLVCCPGVDLLVSSGLFSPGTAVPGVRPHVLCPRYTNLLRHLREDGIHPNGFLADELVGGCSISIPLGDHIVWLFLQVEE